MLLQIPITVAHDVSRVIGYAEVDEEALDALVGSVPNVLLQPTYIIQPDKTKKVQSFSLVSSPI